MACPSCGCKVHYQFDGWGDDCATADDRMERCAACGHVFDIEDSADEDDEDAATPAQGSERGEG